MRYLPDANILSALIRDPHGPVAERLAKHTEADLFTAVTVKSRAELGGLLLLLVCLAGCMSASGRPSPSTLGCAKTVVASLPTGLTDLEKHCLASAGVTTHCSRFEAWFSGWGKELADGFGSGDASWKDLAADRAGRRCASMSDAPDDQLECCRRALATTPADHRCITARRRPHG